jgi:hypothetical protein
MSHKVLGYIKDSSDFRTIAEWQNIARQILKFQKAGYDTRSGKFRCIDMLSCSVDDFEKFKNIINKTFGYLFHDIDRFENVNMKNFFNFVEDFVNYRVWSIHNEFESYFNNLSKLKIAFFYTRDDIEPYVMIDDEFTIQAYGKLYNPKVLYHYTTPDGAKNIATAIKNKQEFDISCFTVIRRPFFRKQSTTLLTILGSVRAGFKSDIKSYAVNNGRRACNLYRLGHPGSGNNLCYDIDDCGESAETSLWNEYITTPLKIISSQEI